ncbi:unnamed protein product, partial [Prorocentrum cordatum]
QSRQGYLVDSFARPFEGNEVWRRALGPLAAAEPRAAEEAAPEAVALPGEVPGPASRTKALQEAAELRAQK